MTFRPNLLLRLGATATALAACVALPVQPAHAAAVQDEIIVRHRADASAAERAEVRADAAVQLEDRLAMPGVEVVDVGSGSRSDALEALRADPDVVWAEPNRPVHIATNDPGWADQWSLQNPGGPLSIGGYPDPLPRVADADADVAEAWAGNAARGAGVTVGVVDSGVQATHPDLAGQLLAGQAFGTNLTPDDENGHGTHVTGTIAAVADNNVGIAGAAPAAKVKPLRALDANGSGTTAGVADAFHAAGEQGLRIVNASLGADGPSNAEAQAILTHPNTLYVVAAGNDGKNVDSGIGTYPCRYTYANVLCVGASTAEDLRPVWDTPDGVKGSNYGKTSVDLFAPGDSILSTFKGSQYAWSSGTSMASPLVAAAAALVLSAHPDWTTAQLKAAILDSVDHPKAFAGVSVTGGRLNAARALGIDVGPDGLAPSTPAGVLATATPGRVDLSWTPSTATDIRDYRVWREAGGGWTVAATVTSPAAILTGLNVGETVTLSVTARDRSGSESTPSAPLTIAVPASGSLVTGAGGTNLGAPPSDAGAGSGSASAPSSAPGQTPGTPTPTVTPSAPPLGLVTNLRTKLVRGRVTALRFDLSAAATVNVVAKRTRTSKHASITRRRTFTFDAGSPTIAIGRGGAASLALTAGEWRVTVSTAGSTRTIRFRLK